MPAGRSGLACSWTQLTLSLLFMERRQIRTIEALLERPIFHDQQGGTDVSPDPSSTPSESSSEDVHELPLVEVRLNYGDLLSLLMSASSPPNARQAWVQGDPLPDGAPRRLLLVESIALTDHALTTDLADPPEACVALYKEGREWWVRHAQA